MPQFAYKAKSGPNGINSGFIEAENLTQAISRIIQSGQTPLEVKAFDKTVEVKEAKQKSSTLKVPRVVLFQFTRQLADLLEAGIPLSRCMELLSGQAQFAQMISVIELMKVYLQQGGSFSSALLQHASVFPTLYINMVKAAELTGQLPQVLDRLAEFLEKDIEMQSKIKSSLLYPTIILCVGILTVFILLSFVLPKLTAMFDEFNAELPLPTQIVMAMSQFFAGFWWLILILLVGAVFAFKRFWESDQGRMWVDTMSLKTPLIKSFVENAQMGRFARTLGTLLESGVPVVLALESVVNVVDNSALQLEVKKIALKVKSGVSLTQAIKGSPLFPEVAVDLIAVGQETGKLERGLYKLATGCERKTQELAQSFVTILGPAVLVVVVGLVGFMIVAMLLPMFKMNMIIQ